GENSLVEAMSLGLPCVVLNNPAEMEIITNGIDGYVANSPLDCTKLLERLIISPVMRRTIGSKAIKRVAETRTPKQAAMDFVFLWNDMMEQEPARCNFKAAIGTTPADWFLSTQRLPGMVWQPVGTHQGATKGSLAHFESVFAGDFSFESVRVKA